MFLSICSFGGILGELMSWRLASLSFLSLILINFGSSTKTQAATLTPSSLKTLPNASISISIAGGPGNRLDWVGLSRVGGSDADITKWKYLNGSKTAPSTGVTSTTLGFTMPSAEGNYEFRFFLNDGYQRIATSQTLVVSNTPTPTPTPSAPKKYSIKHGYDIPTPEFYKANISSMEKMPFDGVLINSFSSDKIQRQTVVSLSKMRAELLPAKNTRSSVLTQNFYTIYTRDGGPLNGNYSIPIANFKAAAQAAKEAGFVGIAFDNENYYEDNWNYPTSGDNQWLTSPIYNACPGINLAQCRDAARARGREVMAAMISVWPEIKVLNFYGVWVSDPMTEDQLSGQFPYNDVSFVNEMAGPFAMGMIEATLDTPARYIDGAEIYTLRTASQFSFGYNWLKNTFAQLSALVPAAFKSLYSKQVDIAFAEYDLPYNGRRMDLATWEATLKLSLQYSDQYAWTYTEKYDWWGVGGLPRVPQAWIDAARRARAAVNGQ